MPIGFQTRISSNIIDFPYDAEIKFKLESFLQNTVNNLIVSDKNDWTVVIQITPTSTNWIKDCNKNVVGVFEKGMTYSKDKEKVFTLAIPVPNKLQIDWGLPKKNYAPRPLAEPEKYLLQDIDFYNYNNLNEYLIECFIVGVTAILKKGITVNKVKYKI
jgi:hypothetical protein